MKRLQKKINVALILVISLLFSNCTAWPAIAALLLQPSKGGSGMALLLPGLFNPPAGGLTASSTPNPTPTPGIPPPPALSSNLTVSTTTTTGYYPAGTVINIRVKFMEAVHVTGIPQFTLNNLVKVNYFSGTATDTLLFRYTVQAGNGEDFVGLDAVSQIALILNEGSIKSVANNSDITLTLPVPGAVYSMGSGKVIVIDTTAPTVTSVNSSSPDGNYFPTQSISIQINFSEKINVTGTPQIKLETGVTDAIVNYTSGSGTSTLTFNYTILSGHLSPDLDYFSSLALALNAGIISDLANNVSILTLAAPGAVGSLGANKAIVLNIGLPMVTNVTSSVLDGNYGLGQAISIQLVFDTNVIVTGNPQLTLETGISDAIVNYTSGSGTNTLTFVYTVVSGNSSPDLDYLSTTALSLNGGTIADGSANNAIVTLATPGSVNSLGANKAIVIDAVLPGVASVTSSTLDGMYGVGQTISIQVVFNKVVIVTGVPKLTLETGGIDAVVSYASGSGTNTLTFTYTLLSPYTSNDLDYISTLALALNGGTIKDSSNNNANLTLAAPGTVGSLGANKAIVVNTTTPTVLFSAATSSSSETITTISIPVVLSAVSALTVTVDYALTGGTSAEYSYRMVLMNQSLRIM